MKILIVDDEASARKLLKGMLTDLFAKKESDLTLFEASCLKDAVTQIKENNPAIVLLDIEMPGNSGLQILDFFNNEPISFQLIFATAYNEYAVEAFKLNAVDYLLKPIDVFELEKAIDKAKEQPLNVLQSKIEELRKTFLELNNSKIVLEVPNGLMFISPKDIIVLVADGVYTTVYLKDGTKKMIARGLKHFIDQIHHHNFFYKPHRSYYVNLRFLKEFNKKDGSSITLENGMTIPLSRDKKEEFLYLIKEVF